MLEELIKAWQEAASLVEERFDERREFIASGTYTAEDDKRSHEALEAARNARIRLGCDLAEVLGSRVYALPDGRFLVPVWGPLNDDVEIMEAYRPDADPEQETPR